MPAELNFFDTYTLMAVQKRIVPKQTFFRDRYFPTEEGDIFSSNKVLTEYMDGDRKMAAFVSPRVGASRWSAWATRSTSLSLRPSV